MSCSYQTVTLTTGQQFVLPPGAELIYVSDPAAYTSDADCAPAPTAGVTCYRFRAIFPGADVDGSIEDFVTGFILDDIQISINPFYTVYGALGTSTGSNNTESAQDYVDRLGQNIWYQLSSVTNGSVIFGVKVTYTDADTSGGDMTDIFISIPDVFTNVLMTLVDTDTQNSPFQIVGIKTCDVEPGVDNTFQIGSFPTT